MRKRILDVIGRCERAQAMILFAVLLPTMVAVMGLAVEGGRVWVEYRRMQAAADMSALIGAQALPCGLTNTTCISAARSLACTYAANNGFSNTLANCAAGSDVVGSGKATVANGFVPPKACAPFDFLDYGNNGIGGCKSKANGGVSFYDYIEVQLQDNLGTIPIFNVPLTLDARAVARHGTPSTSDYAVNVLSSQACAWQFNGNVPYFVTGVTFSNGSMCPGSHIRYGCDGGFLTATPGGDPGSLQTFSGALTQFAPSTWDNSVCQVYNAVQAKYVDATADNPDAYRNSQPLLIDPYCSSLSPPYNLTAGTTCGGVAGSQTSMSNCPDCNYGGFYHDSGGWHQASAATSVSVSGKVELFPGVYGGLSFSNKSMAFFNPGVYTFTNAPDTKFQAFCVYGAPTCEDSACTSQSCDNSLCDSTTLSLRTPANNTVQKGDLWYRTCSPYGKWDVSLPRPTSGVGATAASCIHKPVSGLGPCLDAPTWLVRDPSTGTDTPDPRPLNGVVIYIRSTLSSGSGHGASGEATLAAPNPCAGNGILGDSSDGYWAAGPGVQWPEGTVNSGATFRYPAGSFAETDGHSEPAASALNDQIYPNADWSLVGECYPNNYEIWPGEMPKGQHLHFLYFTRASGTFGLGGNIPGTLFGLMYAPSADLHLHGNSGGQGPPFIYGQVVTSTLSANGTDNITVVYRPCNEKEDACASGLGTQLIQ